MLSLEIMAVSRKRKLDPKLSDSYHAVALNSFFPPLPSERVEFSLCPCIFPFEFPLQPEESEKEWFTIPDNFKSFQKYREISKNKYKSISQKTTMFPYEEPEVCTCIETCDKNCQNRMLFM